MKMNTFARNDVRKNSAKIELQSTEIELTLNRCHRRQRVNDDDDVNSCIKLRMLNDGSRVETVNCNDRCNNNRLTDINNSSAITATCNDYLLLNEDILKFHIIEQLAGQRKFSKNNNDEGKSKFDSLIGALMERIEKCDYLQRCFVETKLSYALFPTFENDRQAIDYIGEMLSELRSGELSYESIVQKWLRISSNLTITFHSNNLCYASMKLPSIKCKLHCIDGTKASVKRQLYKQVIKFCVLFLLENVGLRSGLFVKLTDMAVAMINNDNIFRQCWKYSLENFNERSAIKRLSALEELLKSDFEEEKTLEQILEVVCPGCVKITYSKSICNWYFHCIFFNGHMFDYFASELETARSNAIMLCLKHAMYVYTNQMRMPLMMFPKTDQFIRSVLYDETAINLIRNENDNTITDLCNATSKNSSSVESMSSSSVVSKLSSLVESKLSSLVDLKSSLSVESKSSLSVESKSSSSVEPKLLSSVQSKSSLSVESKSLSSVESKLSSSVESKLSSSVESKSSLSVESKSSSLVESTLSSVTTDIMNGPSYTTDSVPNIISSLVLKKYSEICDTLITAGKVLPGCFVLSGIVMVVDGKFEQGTVIAVCTGNKSVNDLCINDIGATIIDSHAEILCRRALLHYLYGQLERLQNTTDYDANYSIFETIVNENRPNTIGGSPFFRVKSNVSFHLYISSAPCGDARIFAMSNRQRIHNGKDDTTPKNAGKLRVKLQIGVGGIPSVGYNKRLVWDTIRQGGQIISMCCSDKLLKRNVLGLQGSLLSHFIHPIYYDTIVVGDVFNCEDLKRALYGRLLVNKHACDPSNVVVNYLYRINKPGIFCTDNKPPLSSKSDNRYCLNWIVDERDVVDMINANTGKTVDNQPSRLCKRILFRRYLSLLHCFNMASPGQIFSYIHSKQTAHMYKMVQSKMNDRLEKNGCGHWVHKPAEFFTFSEQFQC